jgi:hypothetical protein
MKTEKDLGSQVSSDKQELADSLFNFFCITAKSGNMGQEERQSYSKDKGHRIGSQFYLLWITKALV